MLRNYWQAFLLAIAVIACTCAADAQIPIKGSRKPLSTSGGYAQQELNNIYSRDVGTGYSGASLNQIALQNARAQVPYYGQVSGPGAGAPGGGTAGPRIGLGLGPSAAGKPFDNVTPAPTVSPYLNLFREDLEGGGDLNYNTLVRPLLQQQQFNQQAERQQLEISRRLQQIAAKNEYNPQGSKEQYPTGHETVYMYLGHYYPAAAPHQQQRKRQQQQQQQ